jgi:hypothetical protein
MGFPLKLRSGYAPLGERSGSRRSTRKRRSDLVPRVKQPFINTFKINKIPTN